MDILIVLFVVLTAVTLVGHLIWVCVAAVIRGLFFDDRKQEIEIVPRFDPVLAQIKELNITERQIVRLYGEGKLKEQAYEQVLQQIRSERTRLTTPETPKPAPAPAVAPRPVQTTPAAEIITKPVPITEQKPPRVEPTPVPPPPPRPRRRSFSEVLNSFMEESNIRWGEIIGGLLIIGCSTALVVSLWAQISEIPVLKFIIFTTVTAILFGIGLYTEHRWKLPTTSRGILTIATLLVPLNFLAIAAVSASNSSGGLVIGSELAAPAIFLCLVYFAGRIITPGCAHILSAGVLGSSIGQLLVRHFASVDASPWLLIFLGAFPVMCYVVTVGLALRVVLHDREIDESETTTVFTTLGAMSFAAVLPFGLLLHKSGPIGMSMMYLAPLVTLWGLPLLAAGTILWRKISNKELVAARTAGTALGILGLAIVLLGMILAWPNPASIVPAALLNFAILTALAIALELPLAHVIAALCFALAYLVTGHVMAGDITWENLRVMSLLQVSISVESGQFLVGAVALFVIVSEWLLRKQRSRDSRSYVVAGCITAMVSLALATFLAPPAEHALWVIYSLYALVAFFIAWRRNLFPFTWAGSVLLLFALAHSFTFLWSFAFPWQTALFAHATVCALAAIISSRHERGKVFSVPLNYSALLAIVFGVICLFQANTWQITWLQAERVFWVSGILLLLLWLNRQRILFVVFQIALLCALVLSVKGALQEYDWYSYLPHAFLHPAALQIQGTVLALFCLIWITLRLLARRFQLTAAARLLDSRHAIDTFLVWLLIPAFLLLTVYGAFSGVIRELLMGINYAGYDIAKFPHAEALGAGSWIVLGLLLLAMLMSYWEVGSRSVPPAVTGGLTSQRINHWQSHMLNVNRPATAGGTDPIQVQPVTFEAKLRSAYLLGALAALSGIVPLLAGQFENQLATATAWRWLAAMFLLGGSLVIWCRRAVAQRLSTFGWPTFDGEAFVVQARAVLFALTIVPLVVLTAWSACGAVLSLPVQTPISGFFSLFSNDFAYGVPLVLAGLVVIGHALRERRPDFALYAGAFFNATVTLAFVLSVVTAQAAMDRAVFIRVVQLNAITLAVYMLPWLSTRRRWRTALSQGDQRYADFLLKLQLGNAIGLSVVLFVPALVAVLMIPPTVGIETFAAGGFLGWLSLFTIVIATVCMSITRTIRLKAYALAGFLATATCLVAFNMSNSALDEGVHTLTIGTAVSAWLLFLAAELTRTRSKVAPFPLNLARRVFDLGRNWQTSSRDIAAIGGVLVVLLSLRSLGVEEASAWWAIGPLLAVSTLAATFSWRTKTRTYIAAAGLIFYLSVSVWWLLVAQQDFHFNEFLLVNVITNSLAALVWLWLELRARGREKAVEYYFSFHNFTAVFLLGVLTLVVLLNFFDVKELQQVNAPGLTWLAIASVFTLLLACLLDRYAKYAVAGLYTLGLVTCAFALQQLQLSPTRFGWSVTIVLAVFNLSTALLWHRRARLISIARHFGVPERISPEATHLRWLSAFTILAVAAIAILAYCIDLTFVDFNLRVTAAAALAAQFLTFGLLAEGKWARAWRRLGIAALVTGAVLFGWSWLTPGTNATWLNRSVILMVEAFGITALYGLLLNKANERFPQWTNSARACVPYLLGAGTLALLFCLGTEVRYQIDFGAVLIHPLSLIAIASTLMAAVVISVLFAMSADHDPLRLSERGRMKYVYVAEVMLALLFLHVRLTMPWWDPLESTCRHASLSIL